MREARCEMLANEPEMGKGPLHVVKPRRPRPSDYPLHLRWRRGHSANTGDHARDIQRPLHQVALLQIEPHVDGLRASHNVVQGLQVRVE